MRNNMRNKKKLLYFITIGIIMIILGLVYDCLINSGIFQYYLVVNENYIFYIFSLIFTVATLGCTLLSIIVGVSSNRVLGLQLREIVSLKNSPLKLKTMIIGSMIIVGLSVPTLAFELNTSITMLAVFLIAFIIWHTIVLSKIVFNKEYTKELVKAHLRDSNNVKPEYIQCWITALYKTIEENDISSEEEYLSLLKSAAKEQTQYRDQMEKQLQKLFAASCVSQSFVDSYKRILRLNEPSINLFDERAVVYEHLKSIRYAEPRALNEINLPGTIDSIVMCDFLSDDNKVSYCYWYFDNVLNNIESNADEKLIVVYNGLCRLLWLRDDVGFSDVRVNTAMFLFKYNVLLAKDFDYGKEVYKKIIKAIYKENIYHSAKALASLLSQIVRMIFFWSFLEKETLSEDRRKLISTIPLCRVETIDNAFLSIKSLIERNHENMLEYLISDSFSPERFDPLDYWPEIHNGKTIVCSSENKIRFAFWFYLIWGYKFCYFPIENFVITDTKENQITSKRVCVSVREEFDDEKSINQNSRENISLLQSLFQRTYILPTQYLIASYESINNQIIQINQLQYNSFFNSDTNKIINDLKNSIIDDPEILLDENISLESAASYQLPPILSCNTSDYCSHIVYIIKNYFSEIINSIIKKRLPQVELTFDSTGVKKLKSELEKDNFSYRNYTYYDDWGLSKETIESPEYDELRKLVNAIEEKHNYYLYDNLFLKVDDVKFNYQIESITIENLEGEILEGYLSQYRVSSGQYSIDGGIYNKV